MEFLPLHEIVNVKKEINEAYHHLVEKGLKGKKNQAFQWALFEACFDRTVNGSSYLPNLNKKNITHYKFELSNTIQHYYTKTNTPLAFIFRLIHKSEAKKFHLGLEEDLYPETFGYYLLIQDLRESVINTDDESKIANLITPQEETQYLEKVVTEGFYTEMQAYKYLPHIRRKDLLKWYVKDGSAFNEILQVLKRGQNSKWIITNPYNPSHHLLKSVKVTSMDENTATVRTREYWYLKWWSKLENKYVLNYRETNTQSYRLIKINHFWKIEACLRGIPQTSVRKKQSLFQKKIKTLD